MGLKKLSFENTVVIFNSEATLIRDKLKILDFLAPCQQRPY